MAYKRQDNKRVNTMERRDQDILDVNNLKYGWFFEIIVGVKPILCIQIDFHRSIKLAQLLIHMLRLQYQKDEMF